MPAVFQVQEKHFYCEHRLGLSRHDYNLRKVLLHQELKSESGKVLFSRKPFSFGITSPLPRRACLGLRNENRKVSLRKNRPIYNSNLELSLSNSTQFVRQHKVMNYISEKIEKENPFLWQRSWQDHTEFSRSKCSTFNFNQFFLVLSLLLKYWNWC